MKETDSSELLGKTGALSGTNQKRHGGRVSKTAN